MANGDNTTHVIVKYFKRNSINSAERPLVFQVPKDKRKILSSRRFKLSRIIWKNGRLNTFLSNLPNKSLRYLKDLGNTLITIRWRWILLSLLLANAMAYLLFAFAWMATAIYNGNLEKNSTDTLCIIGPKTFSGYLLLSIETQTTIGGARYPGDCHEGWILITLHALVGIIIDGALVAAIYTKMTRPVLKDTLNLFSKKAVINLKDGCLCLIFRVRDNSGKHRTKTAIRAYFVEERKRSQEGEFLQNFVLPLSLENYGSLIWPLEVVHKITSTSPLWEVSPETLLTRRFEILVLMEGDSLSTGQTSQSRTSYLNTEISWGCRFVPCIHYDDQKSKYFVDHEKFHTTTPYNTPLCSASRLSSIETGEMDINELLNANSVEEHECSVYIDHYDDSGDSDNGNDRE